MAISLATEADRPLAVQAGALVLVGIGITAGVYGVVGLIVKMDDIGLHLAKARTSGGRALGRFMVRAMPVVMDWLTTIGTAAMLWVGGGIIVHGLEHFGLTPIPRWAEAFSHWAGQAPGVGAITGWTAMALASAAVGMVIGGAIAAALHLLPKKKGAAH
jgi:predicted DNA repair protein MutK